MKRMITIATLMAGIALFAGTSDLQARDNYYSGHSGHHGSSAHRGQGHSAYYGNNSGRQSYGSHYGNSRSSYGHAQSHYGNSRSHYGSSRSHYGGGLYQGGHRAATPYIPAPSAYGHGHSRGVHVDIGPLHFGIGNHH